MYIHKPAPEIFRFSSLFDFTMLRKTTNYFLRARLLVEFVKNDFLWKSDSYWILISYGHEYIFLPKVLMVYVKHMFVAGLYFKKT